MGKLFKTLTLMLILFAGASFAMAQSTVKVAPDVAKQSEITKAAEDHLTAKMDLYREKSGFVDIPGFTPTGDPSIDRDAYYTAKKAWKMNQRDDYNSVLSGITLTARPAGSIETSATSVDGPE